MKPTVPFEQLKNLGNYLAQQCKEDPEAYFEGRDIYSVQFTPETGKIDVHIQWPAFRDLVSEHSAKEVHMTLKPPLAGTGGLWYYVDADIDGVTLSACLWRSDLVPDLQKLGYSEMDIAQMDITERMNTFISVSGWANSANIVMQKEV